MGSGLRDPRSEIRDPEPEPFARVETRIYYLAHRAKIIASAAARYAANRGAIIAANGVRARANRDSVNAAQARYDRKPEIRLVRAERESRRRAQKRTGRVEVVDRFLIWFLGTGRCGICGLHVDLDAMHVDHVVPLSKGGPHVQANLQPAHAGCNLRKGGS
ncbi:MAG: HNH endonuclease [Actinomycetota bacterium]|nr:HNH endonuclease [Actinomycetota bacterium]